MNMERTNLKRVAILVADVKGDSRLMVASLKKAELH